MSIQPISPLNVARYELKYRIHASMVEPISEYVASYCELDYYSTISPNGFYVINSLYLDTPSFYIYNGFETGEFEYSCFRIRSYGLDPKPPYYFESKQQIRDFCKKRRGKVPIENFSDLFDCPSQVTDFDPYRDKNVVDFMEKVQTFGLEPQILTQYRRRAFLSLHDNYTRVTFDRDLKYCDSFGYNVKPNMELMTNYDHPDTFADFHSGRHCILELKCERKIPHWLIHLIQCFELTHDRISKYEGALLERFGRATEFMAFDRVRNPMVVSP